MQIFLVQTGETIWEAQQRLDSLAGVPLSETGSETIRRVGKELVPHEPTAICASPGQAEQETADLLARELGLKVRTESALGGLDFGLWQGLTVGEVRHRQPKLYKQWIESPNGVQPPGGESLQQAQDRIRQAVREILKKGKKQQTPVLVLRPIVLGTLRCRLENVELDEIWSRVERDFTWRRYDVDEKEL